MKDNYEQQRAGWVAILDHLCAETEAVKNLPTGSLKSGDSKFQKVKRRDEVIDRAFSKFRIPAAFLAAYFGKTKQGIYAALDRRADDLQSGNILDPMEFEDNKPEKFIDPEAFTEGRIYKHKQGYED